MAHYQNQYGAQSGIDQYGNPIRQTDDFGNVISETGQYVEQVRRTDEYRDTDQYGNQLRPTSEAFETDPYGNRVRRGDVYGDPTGTTGTYQSGGYGGLGYSGEHQQQAKEHHGHGLLHQDKHRTQATSTTTPSGYASAEHGGHQEKKGIMEKIKEKLPGRH